MSASAGDGSQTATIASSQRSEKKHKRTKSDHKKKRAREEDDAAVVEETPRKPKKTKSEVVNDEDEAVQPEQSQTAADESSKKKKRKNRESAANEEVIASTDEPRKERKKSSKHSKEAEPILTDAMDVDEPEAEPAEMKRKEKKKKQRSEEDEQMAEDAGEGVASDEEAQEKKKKRKSKEKSKQSSSADTTASQNPQSTQDSAADLPTDSDFPFFTQTISLYVPFFPVGFDKPLTNVAAQHLDPLLNHYSPVLRGVLLSYSNLNLSDRPAKASTIHPPTDQTPALLHSVDEYAVGFGWLTFDAHLFVPSRGKWMEGVVQLQNEGHIGVVCWNKFNASIEAKRLPQGWKWVDLAKAGAKQNASPASEQDSEEQQAQDEEDMLDGEELQVVEQIHTTGYWVNERGRKVSGKLRFRIKNFDVGLAGDYGYLSIEGTFLNEEEERALSAQEREMEKARRAKQSGLLRPMSRRVPEFSMTRFGKEDQEEDGGQRTVLYKGSRPGTPDD